MLIKLMLMLAVSHINALLLLLLLLRVYNRSTRTAL